MSTSAQTPADSSAKRVLAAARAEFDPEVVYLNTASLGLPPRRSLHVLRQAVDTSSAGRAHSPDYDVPLARPAARTPPWSASTPAGSRSATRSASSPA